MFLDANAHVSINHKALEAYSKFSHSLAGHGHPSSLSAPGREAALALENARAKIAELIGAQNPNQILFTSSCTQACEWAIQMIPGMMEYCAASPLEHPAVKGALDYSGVQVLPCTPRGEVLPANNSKALMHICVHMQNEIGTIQPIKELRKNFLFSDMSQSLGKIPVNVKELNVDLAAFGAHKFGGPGGIGFIYLKDTDLWISFGTGSRYFTDRPGTPDVAGAVASAVALEEAIQTLPERTQKMQSFQQTLETGLKSVGLTIIGDGANRSPNTTYVAGLKTAQNSLLSLSNDGIYVGLGSACGSYSTDISPLMRVLGHNYTLDNVMRISQWGEYDDKDADRVFKTICKVEKIS